MTSFTSKPKITNFCPVHFQPETSSCLGLNKKFEFKLIRRKNFFFAFLRKCVDTFCQVDFFT